MLQSGLRGGKFTTCVEPMFLLLRGVAVSEFELPVENFEIDGTFLGTTTAYGGKATLGSLGDSRYCIVDLGIVGFAVGVVNAPRSGELLPNVKTEIGGETVKTSCDFLGNTVDGKPFVAYVGHCEGEGFGGPQSVDMVVATVRLESVLRSELGKFKSQVKCEENSSSGSCEKTDDKGFDLPVENFEVGGEVLCR